MFITKCKVNQKQLGLQLLHISFVKTDKLNQIRIIYKFVICVGNLENNRIRKSNFSYQLCILIN